MKELKRDFVAGLIVIIPISLSLWLLYRIFRFFQALSQHLMSGFVPGYTTGIGFLALILAILFVGILAQNFIGKKILRVVERILEAVPLFNRIYVFIRGIVQNVLIREKNVFKETVEVELFPGTRSIGFITGHSVDEKGNKRLNLFVPTVPNISTGFYLIIPEKSVRKLDISVEEALKLSISMGIFQPETKTKFADRDHPRRKKEENS